MCTGFANQQHICGALPPSMNLELTALKNMPNAVKQGEHFLDNSMLQNICLKICETILRTFIPYESSCAVRWIPDWATAPAKDAPACSRDRGHWIPDWATCPRQTCPSDHASRVLDRRTALLQRDDWAYCHPPAQENWPNCPRQPIDVIDQTKPTRPMRPHCSPCHAHVDRHSKQTQTLQHLRGSRTKHALRLRRRARRTLS